MIIDNNYDDDDADDADDDNADDDDDDVRFLFLLFSLCHLVVLNHLHPHPVSSRCLSRWC